MHTRMQTRAVTRALHLSEPWPPPPPSASIPSKPIIIQLRASIALPPPPLCLRLPHDFHSPSFSFSFVVALFRTTDGPGDGEDVVVHGGPRAHTDDMMSHRLGRVVSDLSLHSNSRSVTTDHSLHHQSATTTTTSNNEGGNVGKAAKQKLSLLISSAVSWTRSESSGETGSREKNGSRKQQQANGGTGGGRRRRGLEIVLAVRKYVAMVEQLFITSSYSGASSSRPDVDRRRRDGRPHTFTSGRHAEGNANAAAQSSSKRHRGRRLSSAPASLRGSPATSGHLSYVGDSVTKASTSSEVSTMEELQSAIQAAIAHCKNSVAAAAGDRQQQQQRKC